MNIVALILARSGSLRLKNKHLLNLGEKKLIEWTFDLSKNKNLNINSFALSTDDQDIINLSKKYPIINFGLRPKYLSTSKTSSFLAAKHLIKNYEKNISNIDIIVLLQPTSPFRKIKIINQSLELFIENNKNTNVISASKSKDNIYFNGNFYITSKKILLKEKTFIPKNYKPIFLNYKYSVDIDTFHDLKKARSFI